jgi:hypothetical protein
MYPSEKINNHFTRFKRLQRTGSLGFHYCKFHLVRIRMCVVYRDIEYLLILRRFFDADNFSQITILDFYGVIVRDREQKLRF